MFNNKKGLLGNFIAAFIVIAVGFSMMPIVKEQLVLNVSNSTGVSSTLVDIIPYFMGFSILMAALGIVLVGLKNIGIYDDVGEEETEDDEEEEPKKKITSSVVENIKRGARIESKIKAPHEPVKPIFQQGKSKFEVKSKYE